MSEHLPDPASPAPLAAVPPPPSREPSRAYRLTKRLFDLALAAVLLVALAPLLAVLAWLVRRRLGSPVLFRQERPGRDGRIFRLVKFRTMTEARGPDGRLLPDADRLPPFGRWLRATSLDELPELWNILRGEMSFVGPRPLLVEYLGRYSAEQMRRHRVPPGLTGLAQISGRNSASWPDRLRLDVAYADQAGWPLDLRILALTVLKVLRREGIAQPGQATVEKFGGNP